jgi:hypothetical protein
MKKSLAAFPDIGQAYFDHFYWKNIAAKAATIVKALE